VRRQQGKFLPAERTAMQLHVIYGAEMLEMVTNGTINKRVVEFVKFHHKDFSGAGYPADPIQGNEIPIGARIIRICDTFDAMGHDRGYKQGLPPASCLQEMVDDQIRSLLFDPDLFRLFLEMLKDG
jgi:HD-GYP domain-containing protein (c-di-GMP phosphodiesterase class II)